MTASFRLNNVSFLDFRFARAAYLRLVCEYFLHIWDLIFRNMAIYLTLMATFNLRQHYRAYDLSLEVCTPRYKSLPVFSVPSFRYHSVGEFVVPTPVSSNLLLTQVREENQTAQANTAQSKKVLNSGLPSPPCVHGFFPRPSNYVLSPTIANSLHAAQLIWVGTAYGLSAVVFRGILVTLEHHSCRSCHFERMWCLYWFIRTVRLRLLDLAGPIRLST